MSQTNAYVETTGRVVVGQLHSNVMLNTDIAHHYLSALRSKKLVPSARNSRTGWLAYIEDVEGNPQLHGEGFNDQSTALQAARDAVELLAR